MGFFGKMASFRTAVAPVDFTLPDDNESTFTYDSGYREQWNSVLVWYRGHW